MDRDMNREIEKELQAEAALLAEIADWKKRQFDVQETEYELTHEADVEQENLYMTEQQIGAREVRQEDIKKQVHNMTQHLQNLAVAIFQAGMDFNKHASVKLTDIQELQAKYQSVSNINSKNDGTIDAQIITLEEEFLGNGPVIEKYENFLKTSDGEENLVREISLEIANVLVGR